MERLEEEVTPTPGYGREDALGQRSDAVADEEKAEEKPEASEEIVIEEISIDGMCGFY